MTKPRSTKRDFFGEGCLSGRPVPVEWGGDVNGFASGREGSGFPVCCFEHRSKSVLPISDRLITIRYRGGGREVRTSKVVV
jgi:hypothetical protein